MKKTILLASLIMLMMVGIASAATTFVSPKASTTYRTPILINITSGGAYLVNCSVTATSSASGDTWSTQVFNLTAGLNYINITNVTTGMEDASDWGFTGTCYNGSAASETITAIASVTINNTVPTAPTSLTPAADSINTTSTSIPFSATVTGAKVTSCTLLFLEGANPGASRYSMTHSGNTCASSSLTLGSTATYTYIIEANDGLDYINSTRTTMHVSISKGHSTLKYKQLTEEAAKFKPLAFLPPDTQVAVKKYWVWAVLIGLVLIGGYFYIKKRK